MWGYAEGMRTPRRRRLRQALKWLGAAACALLFGVWLSSRWWVFVMSPARPCYIKTCVGVVVIRLDWSPDWMGYPMPSLLNTPLSVQEFLGIEPQLRWWQWGARRLIGGRESSRVREVQWVS